MCKGYDRASRPFVREVAVQKAVIIERDQAVEKLQRNLAEVVSSSSFNFLKVISIIVIIGLSLSFEF